MVNRQQALSIEHAVLQPETDVVRPLLDLVREFAEGSIVRPPHQRKYVWKDDKAKAWIDRIRSGKKPVGVILLYQINNGRRSEVYINDGVQRLTATHRYLENPELYADDKQAAIQYLRSCVMPVQFRHYTSQEQALADFQGINNGTALSTYERYKGTLTLMDGYELSWEPALEKLRKALEANAQRVARRRNKSREYIHKVYRDYYFLLLRWLTVDEPLSDKLSSNTVTDKAHRSGQYTEMMLRRKMENLGPVTFAKEVDLLITHIESTTAHIATIWHERMGKAQGEPIVDSLYSWLLHTSVHRKRTKGIPVKAWADLAEKVLRNGDGKGFLATSDKQDTMMINRGRLDLPRACKIVGSNYYKYPLKRKSRHSLLLGYDHSHRRPFSLNGEGETFPEPASINRARGAQPVE